MGWCCSMLKVKILSWRLVGSNGCFALIGKLLSYHPFVQKVYQIIVLTTDIIISCSTNSLTLFGSSECQFGNPCRFLIIWGMIFAPNLKWKSSSEPRYKETRIVIVFVNRLLREGNTVVGGALFYASLHMLSLQAFCKLKTVFPLHYHYLTWK